MIDEPPIKGDHYVGLFYKYYEDAKTYGWKKAWDIFKRRLEEYVQKQKEKRDKR